MTTETPATPPEGATSVTANDVVAAPVPERFEAVELWAVTSFGKTEVITVRPEIGESCKMQQSPLDGSFLAMLFEFHAGDDANKKTGQQFFSLGPGVSYKLAYHQMPIYKEGNSPAEIELARRQKERALAIERRAALLAQDLDED